MVSMTLSSNRSLASVPFWQRRAVWLTHLEMLNMSGSVMEMGAEQVWFPDSSVVQPGMTVVPPKAHSGVRALCTKVRKEPKPIVRRTMVITSVNAVKAPVKFVPLSGVMRHVSSLVSAVTSPVGDAEHRFRDVPKHCPRLRMPGKVALMQFPVGTAAKVTGTSRARTNRISAMSAAVCALRRT